jgi:hypothetical protein
MTKRLQVLLPDPDYRAIQRLAREQHMTIAQWVRQAISAARRVEPAGNANAKIAAIRAATQHSFPTADIDAMLRDIDSGYGARNDLS